ncbi:Uma2 family endonuclease [Sorangium sp. So ce1000]|uniref:Uma2 family endonuclease n=1 Tax=Sorangium sp. So ce1000 TaxID=3133325 RepID=UPI003F60B137
MVTVDNGPPSSGFMAAWHLLNWLLVLACPRIFHRMGRMPPREHMVKLVDDYLPYARSERQQRSWKHGRLFQVDTERRQMLAARLRALLMEWSPPELPPEITETARALLDTEGHDPPLGGWGNLPDPDMPPEDFLLWPEGTPALIRGFRELPTPEEQPFPVPADPPARARSAEIEAERLLPVAERIAGRIYVEPRPALRQVMAASILGGLLVATFQQGTGGRGGSGLRHQAPEGDPELHVASWVILHRPEIHLGGDVLLPDLAAWRAERAPRPTDEPATPIAPDWICDILGPDKSVSARKARMHVYAREGLSHAWLLDPFERTLEVLQLGHERQWQMLEGFAASLGHARVRAVPFDAMELDLALLFPE